VAVLVSQVVTEVSVHIKSMDAAPNQQEDGTSGHEKRRVCQQVIRLPRIMLHLLLVATGIILAILATLHTDWVRVMVTILDLSVAIPKLLLWYLHIYGDMSQRIQGKMISNLTPSLKSLLILHGITVGGVALSCILLTWWRSNFFAATRAYSILLVLAVEFRKRIEAFIMIAIDEDEDINHTAEERLSPTLVPTQLLLIGLFIVSIGSFCFDNSSIILTFQVTINCISESRS
jgi:hypothetical protein